MIHSRIKNNILFKHWETLDSKLTKSLSLWAIILFCLHGKFHSRFHHFNLSQLSLIFYTWQEANIPSVSFPYFCKNRKKIFFTKLFSLISYLFSFLCWAWICIVVVVVIRSRWEVACNLFCGLQNKNRSLDKMLCILCAKLIKTYQAGRDMILNLKINSPN